MSQATAISTESNSVATVLAYSEWRPVRWRVRTAARSYGLFDSHQQASRFADGLFLYPEHADSVRIIRIENAAHLVWQGDDIGVGDKPAIIHFVDDFGILRSFTVADTLNHRMHVDPPAHRISTQSSMTLMSPFGR
ncbi:hypothetical protein [Paraburkholderia sp. GAS334]|uniref:hypothetical protein n=1 Tax=Paraburkholderia sp. GAS334 TaxID=3035131 RepID=UPI003D1BF306